MIKVLVADDHPLIRKGIRLILEETTDITVESEASTGNEVLKKVRKNGYDIVLLDIAMPGKGGLETLEELKNENPKIRVLILSTYSEEQFAIRAIRAGASGYLTKNTVPDELVEAIRRISQGLRYITPSIAEMLADDIAGYIQDNYPGRDLKIEVNEDGENGAVSYYPADREQVPLLYQQRDMF